MMRFFLAIVLAWIFVCCTRNSDKKTPVEQLYKLERVFETGNWKVETPDDTGYVFFSREGDVYLVYSYTMKNGDSVGTRISKIKIHSDSIVWDQSSIQYILTEVDDNTSRWKSSHAGYLKFTKLDSMHIVLNTINTIGGVGYQRFDTLKRTLPISTFLVRSKYDYLHGTHTADSLR